MGYLYALISKYSKTNLNQRLHIYIVEDMAITRASLEANLTKSNHKVIGSKATAEEAWTALQSIPKIDLILIDIHLAGDKDGIWLASKIREKLNVPFIYLTAFGDDQTLQKIVNTKPNGYLMKPYNLPTLLTTIQIAMDNFYSEEERMEMDKNKEHFIFIKDSNLKVKLFTKDIAFIQSDGNYLYVQTADKKHVIRSKMMDFLDQLPNDIFVRIHQRYVININQINQLSKNHILMGEIEIPLSSKYKSHLMKVLNL